MSPVELSLLRSVVSGPCSLYSLNLYLRRGSSILISLQSRQNFDQTYNTCLILRKKENSLHHVQSSQVLQDRAKGDAMYLKALR